MSEEKKDGDADANEHADANANENADGKGGGEGGWRTRPPADLDAAPSTDEPVPAEATEDHPEDVPPDPGSADAASPRLQSIVESLLFAADKPLTLKQLGDLLGETELARVRAAVAAVELAHESRGFQLHQVAGGYQFRHQSRQCAVGAEAAGVEAGAADARADRDAGHLRYRQPVTRPEIDEIRGVDSGGTLKTLLDRSLVRIVGKKEEPGRPILYGTTNEFLEFFNLRDLKDLPTLREFHELSEEHQAQVAALEGVAPEGSIEKEGEEAAARRSADCSTRARDHHAARGRKELEEIDRLIRTAGVSTDMRRAARRARLPEEFEHQPTREFEAVTGEPTKIHANTIPTPDVEVVDDEFDRSETTNKKPRPEGLDADDGSDESEAT